MAIGRMLVFSRVKACAGRQLYVGAREHQIAASVASHPGGDRPSAPRAAGSEACLPTANELHGAGSPADSSGSSAVRGIRNEPLVTLLTFDPQWIVLALVRPGNEAVERHRDVDLESAHLVTLLCRRAVE